MSRQKYVMGNWKMNGRHETLHALLQHIQSIQVPSNQEVVVFPPYVYLEKTAWELRNSHLKWGAQNISAYEDGAYTGEISGGMLKDVKCSYVLVGHSERRQYFAETDALLLQKITQALKVGLKPVLCVGETLTDYQGNQTQQKVLAQLESVLKSPSVLSMWNDIIIAYEPVWAIGAGLTPDPEKVRKVHRFIREAVAETSEAHGETLSLLYGGSVKATNAKQFFMMPEVDGLLVGGASLIGEEFKAICHAMTES